MKKIFSRLWPDLAAFSAAACLAALLAASCAPSARVVLPPELPVPAVGRLPAEPAAEQGAPTSPAPPPVQGAEPIAGLAPLFAQVKSRYAFYAGQLGQWRALHQSPEGSAGCLVRLEEILHSYEQLLVQGSVRYPDLERFVRVTNSDMRFLAGPCDALLRAGKEQAGERAAAQQRQEEAAELPAALPLEKRQPPRAAARESAGAAGFEEPAVNWPLAPAPAPVSAQAVQAVEPSVDQLPAGQEEQWGKAVNLLEMSRYEEAIQAFSLLRGTGYDGLARERIAEAENLAAFEMRRTAAALFVQAGRAGNTEKKRRLLLDSRRILLEILEKYPGVEIRDRVLQNLHILENHLAGIGPGPGSGGVPGS